MQPTREIGYTGPEAEVPVQYSHSVKIEETAQGIRIAVHVYANSQEEAIVQTFETYTNSVKMAQQLNILQAPMVVKENKSK